MIGLLNVWFIGQLGNTALLGGVGMGTMLLNVFCLALTFGLNGSIETFVSVYNGKGEFQKCGETLNKARIIVTLILVPVFVMFFWADSILMSIGQDPEVSLLAK
jgi:MATE family multidrug resistance protein